MPDGGGSMSGLGGSQSKRAGHWTLKLNAQRQYSSSRVVGPPDGWWISST